MCGVGHENRPIVDCVWQGRNGSAAVQAPCHLPPFFAFRCHAARRAVELREKIGRRERLPLGDRPMNWNHGLRMLLAVGCVAASCAAAYAQRPIQGSATPLSSAGGFARQEMTGIYQQSIGTGYSSQSLNQIALSNAQSQYFRNIAQGGGIPGVSSSQSRVNFQPSGGGGAKPFSSFSPGPTTSPYLNLFREDFGGNSDLNYNTLVRPQLQQQAFNQQVQRQGQEMARRMQSMAAQSDFNPQGDKNQLPTGHQTAFGYYGHFHPNKPYRPGKSF